MSEKELHWNIFISHYLKTPVQTQRPVSCLTEHECYCTVQMTWMVLVLVYRCRCWTSHEASPSVSDPQSGVTLWTLQENDGNAETHHDFKLVDN